MLKNCVSVNTLAVKNGRKTRVRLRLFHKQFYRFFNSFKINLFELFYLGCGFISKIGVFAYIPKSKKSQNRSSSSSNHLSLNRLHQTLATRLARTTRRSNRSARLRSPRRSRPWEPFPLHCSDE